MSTETKLEALIADLTSKFYPAYPANRTDVIQYRDTFVISESELAQSLATGEPLCTFGRDQTLKNLTKAAAGREFVMSPTITHVTHDGLNIAFHCKCQVKADMLDRYHHDLKGFGSK